MNMNAELERLEDSDVPVWALKSGFASLLAQKGSERRRHARFVTDDPALMRIVEPYSPVRWVVRVLDVSKSGMRLMVPTPLAKGRLIQIHMKDTCVLAKVRHCGPADTTSPDFLFQAGVEIQHVF
jgi:hypothetical protein